MKANLLHFNVNINHLSASKILRLFVLSVLVLLPACGSMPSTPPAETSIAESPTLDQNLATITPTSHIIPPTATPSSTTAPVEVKILPTTYEQPGAWDFQRPYSDPNAPRLITTSLDGFQLDPGFQVASIELAYRWIGIGDTVHDYQRIERRGDSFWREDTPISAEAVSRLVQSIGHMYAEPHTVSITTHTDDYPFWTVELTDVKGENILIYSNSNSLNFIPWNVIYNGEIYAQFDGQIAAALFDLFTVVQGETLASTWGPQEKGYLWATTMEPPPHQLTEGYSGLIPFFQDFSYVADPQKAELRGFLSGFKWTLHSEVGDVDLFSDLEKIELDASDGQTVTCPFEKVPEEDPEWASELFACPIGKPDTYTAYHYPIRFTFSTSTGKPCTLSGELFGYWQPETILPAVPYPDEIGTILASSPLSGDLISDHIAYSVRSYALADALTGRMDHQWEAELVLLGQAQVGERIVPYTVEFDEVKIQDAKVVTWNLDRIKLQALLQEVLSQSVTQRFLEMEPNPVLNLYYYENLVRPIINTDELQPCVDLPLAKDLPLPWEPLRGFSFNLSVGSGIYSIQILLLDDGLRIFNLDIDPSSAADSFWTSRLPASLKPEGAPPFKRIYSVVGGSWMNIVWADDASDEQVSYYKAMLAGWDTKDLVFDPGLQLLNQHLELMPDERLVLVDCSAP